MKRLAIFDLDGTLLNTIADLGAAANHTLAEHGFPVHPLERYRFFVGDGVARLMERALREAGRDESLAPVLLPEFKSYYMRHSRDLTRPYDGIPELLAELRARGVRLAVASNKFQAATDDLVAHFFPGPVFDAVLGQREGVPPKPDPRIVRDALRLIPVEPSDVLYIGDTGIDMRTAAAAGVESAGVIWGFRSEEELLSSGAVHIARCPSDLLDWI